MDIDVFYQRANNVICEAGTNSLDFGQFRQLMDDLGFYWLGWNCDPWPKEG